MTTSTILDKILETKRAEVQRAKQSLPLALVRESAEQATPCRDFIAHLRDGLGPVRLIAEVKKASPSAGLIRADFAPLEIAAAYERAGASCLSVLTDEPFFQGKLSYLVDVRRHVSLPVLRKDFIIDPYQVYEARAAGADCILLIAECLDRQELFDLHQLAIALGMQTLIELYDIENLPAVLDTGGKLVGVNNRDLRTFHTDLNHTLRVQSEIPNDRLLVAESGIRTHADVCFLADAGVQAMLVGESLMRKPDIEAAVRELLNVTH